MFRALTPLAAIAASTVSALLLSTPAVAAPAPPPSSMTSLGDSISRGFNACGWFSDCTSRIWSTGTDASVKSHYLRIRAKNSAISGRNYNDARSGANSSHLLAQAQSAAKRNPGYVTILMGANDACSSSESTMTSASTFRTRIDQSLSAFKASAPNVWIFISSVPDLKRLWAIGKGNSSARTAWSTFGICKPMLANAASTSAADEARRNRVRQRVIEYNTQLKAACDAYGANCRFDDNAAFNYPFALSQVSTWDYFHPNAEGQRVLAEISYAHGFNW